MFLYFFSAQQINFYLYLCLKHLYLFYFDIFFLYIPTRVWSPRWEIKIYRPQTLCYSALFYCRSLFLFLSVARAGRKIRSLRARARNRNDNAPRRGHRVNTTLPGIDFSTLYNPRSAPSSPRFRYKHALSVVQLKAKPTRTVFYYAEKMRVNDLEDLAFS